MAFVEKYRPRSLDEVVGNAATIRRLKKLLNNRANEPFPNALIFVGSSGCGKTTTAYILAQELNGGDVTEQNFIEKNCAQENGIDVVRELDVGSQSLPMVGDFKIYLLDEVQEMTPQAKKALLKTIESAKGSTIFILCTMEPGRLPKELLTRCQQFKFDFPTRDDLKDLVSHICGSEDMEMNREVFDLCIRNSGGSVRQFVQHLEAIKQFGAQSPEDLKQVVTDYFQRDAAKFELAVQFIRADDMKGRIQVLSEVDDAFGFTNLLLDVCAQNLDKQNGADLQETQRIIKGVIRSREQIQSLIGVDPRLILVSNLV